GRTTRDCEHCGHVTPPGWCRCAGERLARSLSPGQTLKGSGSRLSPASSEGGRGLATSSALLPSRQEFAWVGDTGFVKIFSMGRRQFYWCTLCAGYSVSAQLQGGFGCESGAVPSGDADRKGGGIHPI